MKKTLFDQRRMRNIQDGLFALLVTGVATAFMLFLLGSTDLLTSLSIIGLLLCLSLVGSTMRFLSMTRFDRDLEDRQNDIDQTVKVLQHRVGDHDLLMLQMVGQIETLETGLTQVRKKQDDMEIDHQHFMRGMKDRMIQLASVLTRSRTTAPTPKSARATAPAKPVKKTASKNFFTPPAKTANDAQPKIAATTRYDEDVYVSPSLLRDAIANTIKNQQIDLYLQPIATLPQRQVHAYELYGRIRLQAGVYIPATQYRGFAVHAGHMIDLDRLVIQALARLHTPVATVPLMMSVALDSLMNPAILIELARAMKQRPDLKNRLVIALTQRDWSRVDDRSSKIIQELQTMGLKFAMNDVQNPDLDLNQLARLGVGYMKLSHTRLLTTKDSEQGAGLVHRFITRLQARNIRLVVSGIETAQDVRTMLDYPIGLVQGYAFGKPDRPAVYQARMAPARAA